jgi:hypothetical protein
MNHAIVTATAPVPAKLYLNLISTVFLSNLPLQTEGEMNGICDLQESSLDAPCGDTRVINHKRRAEAEHDTNQVRACEGPGCGSGS